MMNHVGEFAEGRFGFEMQLVLAFVAVEGTVVVAVAADADAAAEDVPEYQHSSASVDLAVHSST